MKQNDGLSDVKEVFDIAQVLRRFVAEQLARGRSVVPESEVHEFLDNKFPDWPMEVRHLIVRSELDRLVRAAVI